MRDVWLLLCILASGLATLGLARGLRARLADRRPAGESERKPRETPVALVGGAAILLALALWEALGGVFLRSRPSLGPFSEGGLAPLGAQGGAPWTALLLAFAVGLADDLRGLGPRTKLAGQAAVGLALALEWNLALGPGLGVLALTVVALNAWNTFDHADGTASLPALLFLSPMPGAWAGLLGFLPFNLMLRRGPERAPLAYLGDSGSHLLGLLVLLSPWGPWALIVPVLDLVRVALLRWREGRAVWEGDRRHLGHRLEARGLTPGRAALAVALLSWTAGIALAGPAPGILLLAALVPAVGWGLLIAGTPDPPAA